MKVQPFFLLNLWCFFHVAILVSYQFPCIIHVYLEIYDRINLLYSISYIFHISQRFCFVVLVCSCGHTFVSWLDPDSSNSNPSLVMDMRHVHTINIKYMEVTSQIKLNFLRYPRAGSSNNSCKDWGWLKTPLFFTNILFDQGFYIKVGKCNAKTATVFGKCKELLWSAVSIQYKLTNTSPLLSPCTMHGDRGR